jgi:hypothetical protein
LSYAGFDGCAFVGFGVVRRSGGERDPRAVTVWGVLSYIERRMAVRLFGNDPDARHTDAV